MRMIDGKPEYKNGLVSNYHVTLWCFVLTADFGDEISSSVKGFLFSSRLFDYF